MDLKIEKKTMKSFDVFLIKKMVTLTRRNNLKWKPNTADILVSDIVTIDVHTFPIRDSFLLERKQKLNPTKEHPYLYELNFERNFILSSETFNTPLYEFGQWLFADDANWYDNTHLDPSLQTMGTQGEIRQAVDSLNIQIQGLEKELDIVKRNIEKFQDTCDHIYLLSPQKHNFMSDSLNKSDDLFGEPLKLYVCTNCSKENWDLKNMPIR